MLNYLSKKSASFFINNQFIPSQYEKLAVYGFEQIFSSLVSISLVLVISFFMNCMLEGFVFLFLMVSVRQLTGGYHANTSLACNTIFTLCYLVVLFSYIYLQSLHNIWFIIISNIFCVILTYLLAPISNPKKSLNYEKKKRFKLYSFSIIIIIFFLTLILYIYNQNIAVFITLTIICINVLMILGYKNNQNHSIIV